MTRWKFVLFFLFVLVSFPVKTKNQVYFSPNGKCEKEIIDSMDFSFEGFTKVASSQTSSSNKNTSNSNENNDKELAKRVYNWCQDRFDYYDKKDGYYTGDKHDDDVFEDAAKHFGRSKSEVKKLYDDGGYYIVKGE